MRPIEGPITTDYFEPRSLATVKALQNSNLTDDERTELQNKLHNHAAIDIAPLKMPENIRAPEDGKAFAWAAFRVSPGMYWPQTPIINGEPFIFRNYFYDTFGGVIVIKAEKYTHVITHSFQSQLFESRLFAETHVYEEKKKCDFPLHAVYSSPRKVQEGDIIGRVGDAGKSSNPHIHWEIHTGSDWNSWDKRMNPEMWLRL